MAEFIQLTHVEGTPLILRASLIYCVKLDSDKITRVEGCREPSVGYSYRVKESPSEVLSLLAGEREGKAEGIQDVVDRARKMLSWYDADPQDGDGMQIDGMAAGSLAVGDLRRLVAYFDGRA